MLTIKILAALIFIFVFLLAWWIGGLLDKEKQSRMEVNYATMSDKELLTVQGLYNEYAPCFLVEIWEECQKRQKQREGSTMP